MVLSDETLQRNGNAGMRHAVSEVCGAINRIDDPAERVLGIAADAFLSEHAYFRIGTTQRRLNTFLAADVEFQLNVVLHDVGRRLVYVEVFAHHVSRLAGSSLSTCEHGFELFLVHLFLP